MSNKQRRTPRHAQLRRDSEGLLEIVETVKDTTTVMHSLGYARPKSIACRLQDTGNGFIARFPAHSSIEQDNYVCLGYDQARTLVLALSPHAKGLGFDAAMAAQKEKL